MAFDVTEEAAELLDSESITLIPHEIQGDVDGAGKVLVCKGDLPQGCSVRGAQALVVEGNIQGGHGALCEIFCEETVIVLGGVVRAHIRASRLLVGQSVENVLLQISKYIEISGNASKSQIRVGASTNRLNRILSQCSGLEDLKRAQSQLRQEVGGARRSLDKLLQVTGVVFNLNIGKIVKQSVDGLQIDLTSFYDAVPGRSDAELDTALRQFFAKAVLGLLTRLNREYISSGRGHQERFKKVVLKLQDLVFKSRELDKCDKQVCSEEAYVKNAFANYAVGKPRVSVQAKVKPSFEVVVQGIDFAGGAQKPVIGDYRLQVEQGKRKGTQEARFFNGKELKDLVFVSEESLKNVLIRVAEGQIQWQLRS